ncbi:DUF3048 C-terminal domain-containing protein [Streptomyces sp. NPDC101152]|uniref:DUF3048 domain-containing protein n=1 Tax=Streptomyces sp. NPDC101152 TaxID=3366116 RepID=UPI00381E99AE
MSLTGALPAAVATAALAAGCTGQHHGDDGRGRTKAPSPAQITPAPARSTASPGHVLAVKIDNATDARQRQYDDPTLAFSGAQSELLPLIDKAPLRAEPPVKASAAYVRGSTRAAPHNLYLHPARLMRSAPGPGALTNGFRYGAAPAGGRPDTSLTVRHPAARFTFTWSGGRHGWHVAMDGTPSVTADGQPVTPATVVVQYVRVRGSRFHDFLGNATPFTETVGSGRATVLRDGKAYDVGWKRARDTDGTDFTTGDGRPVDFAKRQVWVVFTPAS